MCLILFAYRPESDHPLVVAANRDELYARAAQSAHYWERAPDLLAGRDLSAGGTWLGVTRGGRFAAVTNFSSVAEPDGVESRGAIPHEFLTTDASPLDFAHQLRRRQFSGFNLLAWDGIDLVYASNRGPIRVLEPGVYGLSNAELGAAWPKVTGGVRALQAELTSGPSPEGLLAVLADQTIPADDELPSRGRPIEQERLVASRFINGEEYGTRASTAVIVGRSRISFTEQQFGPGGHQGGRRHYEFTLSSGKGDGEHANNR